MIEILEFIFQSIAVLKKRKFEKRAINKFRRKQLKLDEIIKCNRFGKYWA